MAEGEHLKMILVNNKSPHAVTLYILQNWSKSRFLSLSFIVNGGESFLFHRKTTFRFELTAPPEKKNITIWGPIMWEKDILLRVSGDDDIQVKDEELPKEKQICLRRNNMKEEVSASGMKNLYEILGLNMKEVRKKSIEEQNEIIKKAYYSQLRRWHPDRNPGNDDKAICQEIINAYEILKDPEARAAYNNVADYDKGWFSKARWRAVFKPECYNDEQKKQYRKRMGLLILSSALVAAGIGLTFVTAGMAGPVVLGMIAGATFRCGISSRSRELIDNAKAFKKYFISLMIDADGGAAMGAGVAEITKLLDGEAKLALKDAKLSLERQIAITMTRNVFRGFTNSVANNLDAVLADGQKITWEEFLLHVLTDALLGGIAGLREGLTENIIEKLVSAKDVAAAFEVISSSTPNRFEVVTKIAVETFANLIEHLDDDVESNSVEDDIKNGARLAAIAVGNYLTMRDNEVSKIIEDGEDITEMEAKSNEAFHDISEATCDETKNYANSTTSAARNAKETVGKDGITTTSDNEESTRDSNDVSDKFQKSNREIKQDDCGENAKGNSDKLDKTLQVYVSMPVETNVKGDFTKRTPPYEKKETNCNECTQLAGQRMTYISEGTWFSKMLVDYEEDGEEKHHEGKGSGSSILIPDNATNIKVSFQVMRAPGVWCDVKKYNFTDDHWEKPIQTHIFEYNKPRSLTYTLAGKLYHEVVKKVSLDCYDDIDDNYLPKYNTLTEYHLGTIKQTLSSPEENTSDTDGTVKFALSAYEESTRDNNDKLTKPGKLKYISKEKWLSKMLVDYEKNGEEKHVQVKGSGNSILIPNNATNIKVRFQVMRAPGVWCDVKKYDHFKKCWVEPRQPHIFKYDKPVSCTYTLDGNLYYEKVTKIIGEYFREMFDCDLPRYKTLVDETTNRDEFKGPVKHELKYISEGLWLSKMLVDFQENGETKHYEIEDSESSFLLPTNATNIKVRFQIMRVPGIWCDVKKYDRFNKYWVKPIQPHIFEYDKPLSRTFTLADCEAVMKITGGDDNNTFDIDGRAQSREEFGSYDGAVKLVDNKDHISADVKVDHVIEDSQLAMLSSTLNSGIKESNPIVSDEVETHSVDSGFEERNNAFYKWFDMGAFHENGEMKKEYKEKMARFKWVQSFSIVDAYEEGNDYNLEIVCKYGEVPCNEDIVELLGEDILPCITYKKASKIEWFKTNVLDENFEIKREYANGLLRLEWVESFKIIKADRKGSKRCLEIVLKFATVPCTHDLVELFGEEVLPFITYKKEGTFFPHIWLHPLKIINKCKQFICHFIKPDDRESRRKWFEKNVFDENFTMKEESMKKLAGLPWVKDFYVGVTNEPEKSWQIYITHARDQAPSMVDLKKIFGVNIASFVDFIQESTELLPSPRFLRGPKSGDKIFSREKDDADGTISILTADRNEHYAITCYHSCFIDPHPCCDKTMSDLHGQLKEDHDHENSRGCKDEIRVYNTENLKEGKFHQGLYDDNHDIALIKLEESENCINAVNFIREENINLQLASNKKVAKMLFDNGGRLNVEKLGTITGVTRGTLYTSDGKPLFGTENMRMCYRIKGTHGQVFATEGDSGSLLYIIESSNRKIPFGYLCSEIQQNDNSAVYGGRNLKNSIDELKERKNLGDIQPCGMDSDTEKSKRMVCLLLLILAFFFFFGVYIATPVTTVVFILHNLPAKRKVCKKSI